MGDRTILTIGVVGTIVAAICCFTPALVVGLGVVGLSAWLGWIDDLLMPLLGVFLPITVFALWKRKRETSS